MHNQCQTCFAANPPELLALIERFSKKAAMDDGTALQALATTASLAEKSSVALTAADCAPTDGETMDDRLRRLTTMKPVVLFMKGNSFYLSSFLPLD
jgi:hypothetical protein